MSAKEYRSGKLTKEWILETAIRLFNEHGTHAVSTKRIAVEMGISPGNLYYHFNNKEQIIREIFKKMSQDFALGQEDESTPPLNRFLGLIENIMVLWRNTPFFQREMVVLLNHDNDLKKLYMKHKQGLRRRAQALFQEMLDAGALREHAESDGFESVYTTVWIIADFWISFLDINGEIPTQENLFKGIDLIMQVWRPFLNNSAIRGFDLLREQFQASNKTHGQ